MHIQGGRVHSREMCSFNRGVLIQGRHAHSREVYLLKGGIGGVLIQERY